MATAVVSTQAGIYQLALMAAFTRHTAVAVEDGSAEANACDVWYDDVRQQVFRAAPWPDNRAFARLSEISSAEAAADWGAGDPDPGFERAYTVPDDCLRPRYLTTYERFALGNISNTTPAIMTNMEDALLCYTMDLTNVALWSSDLKFAVAYSLAAHISAGLHTDMTRARTNLEKANLAVTNARVHAANQDEENLSFVPSWIVARGGYIAPLGGRFIFPDGPMISVEGVSSVV